MDIARIVADKLLRYTNLSIRINSTYDSFSPYAKFITALTTIPIQFIYSDHPMNIAVALFSKGKKIWVTNNELKTKLELNTELPLIEHSLLQKNQRYAPVKVASTEVTSIETISSPHICLQEETPEGTVLHISHNNQITPLLLERALLTPLITAPLIFSFFVLSLLDIPPKDRLSLASTGIPHTSITAFENKIIIDISNTHSLVEALKLAKNIKRNLLLICDSTDFENHAQSLYSRLPYQAHLFITGQTTNRTIHTAEQMGFILNKSFFCYKSLRQASYHLERYHSQEYIFVVSSKYSDPKWTDILLKPIHNGTQQQSS